MDIIDLLRPMCGEIEEIYSFTHISQIADFIEMERRYEWSDISLKSLCSKYKGPFEPIGTSLKGIVEKRHQMEVELENQIFDSRYNDRTDNLDYDGHTYYCDYCHLSKYGYNHKHQSEYEYDELYLKEDFETFLRWTKNSETKNPNFPSEDNFETFLNWVR